MSEYKAARETERAKTERLRARCGWPKRRLIKPRKRGRIAQAEIATTGLAGGLVREVGGGGERQL